MMERLKTLTGDRKPIERVDPALANDPVKPITQTPVVPNGYKPEPPRIEWRPATQHANGEASQVSEGGTYSVLGRRTPEGFRYYSRHGIAQLGTHMTATDARTRCLLHLIEACEG
jgi:hypothetical protein